MAANTLNILKPSVNNLTARVFVRAAGLDFEEVDVWGQTTGEEYLDKYPAHLTPMLETEALPGGYLGESCAIMTYLCAVHGLDDLYPRDPGERAIVDAVPGRGRLVGGERRAQGAGRRGCDGRYRRAARGLQHVLPRRQAVHRRLQAVDRGHPPGRVARVPARDRLPVPAVGRAVRGERRGNARRGVLGTGCRRPRLHRVRPLPVAPPDGRDCRASRRLSSQRWRRRRCSSCSRPRLPR